MKVIEEEARIRVMKGEWSPRSLIQEISESEAQEDPFYIMDLGQVVARYNHWKEVMPRVEPFYAVKCNDDPLLIRTLAALGTGFDCASKGEIQLVVGMGVRPQRIIFANPAKMASHIKYAASVGVDTMTFDSETELLKVKQHTPRAQLVIRIRCEAEHAMCPLGMKFGCDPVLEAPRLLKLAAVLGLDVVGVSFHVGSGTSETTVYARAIQYCRALFTLGANVGLNRMTLLDIGGGFPGDTNSSILEVSRVINESLDLHFPVGCGVRVIAEPGRYFAAAAYTLATMVYAKRELAVPESAVCDAASGSPPSASSPLPPSPAETHAMYFINDGVYGSFNCLLYDHQHVHPIPLKPSLEKPVPCSVWGPTCDGLDCVCPRALLPTLSAGDWLLFEDMGAYTLPVASAFNGFPVPSVRHVVAEDIWSMLKEQWPLSECHFSPAVERSPAATPPPPTPPPRDAERAAHLLHAVFVECALK